MKIAKVRKMNAKQLFQTALMLGKRGIKGEGVMNLIFAIILVVAVAIPIASSVVSAANLTGITATVAGYITLFLALGVLYLVARSTGMGS